MGVEIERKFLLTDEARISASSPWQMGRALHMTQGYLSTRAEAVVRARVSRTAEGTATGYLTIKGANTGATRAEYEYRVPAQEAEEMLASMCAGVIDKTRYVIEHDGMTWEVDEFHGSNVGLIVAEIELEDEAQTFAMPPWVGNEVTGDARYYNSSLSKHPYSNW